jgi:2-aminoethylphosphonate-pyruvate transaminase
MHADVGSRQPEMIEAIAYTRRTLLDMAHVSPADGYECVLQPGTGTFCIESVIGSVLPREGGRLLVLANGAYGERIGTIAARLAIPHDVVASDERHAISPDAVRRELARRPYSHVAAVHHETTCGVLNPIEEVSALAGPAAVGVQWCATLTLAPPAHRPVRTRPLADWRGRA